MSLVHAWYQALKRYPVMFSIFIHGRQNYERPHHDPTAPLLALHSARFRSITRYR